MNDYYYDRCSLFQLREWYLYVFLVLMMYTTVALICTLVFANNDAYNLSPHTYSSYHNISSRRESLKLNVSSTLPSIQQHQQKCMYPLVAMITPEYHLCQEALVLYGSIVRTVIAEKLPKKSICINFIYIDKSMSLNTMKKWEEKPNPYANVTACSTLVNAKLNDIIPVHWYAIPKLIPPSWSKQFVPSWSIAVNKIHIWAFDLYERIFILDVDIVVLREITKIMDEIPMTYDISGGIDGYFSCNDRFSLNGGAILMKANAYLHSAALQMLDDKQASCVSHCWNTSEQELLNCMCGYVGDHHPWRPEFKCHLLPIYDHIFSHNLDCLDAKTRPLRMVHYTSSFKVWKTPAGTTTAIDKLFWWCINEAMSPSVATNATTERANTTDALMKCKLPFSL